MDTSWLAMPVKDVLPALLDNSTLQLTTLAVAATLVLAAVLEPVPTPTTLTAMLATVDTSSPMEDVQMSQPVLLLNTMMLRETFV
jgi:hypothetical protein